MIATLLEGLPNQSMQQGAFDEAVGKYMADLPTWGAEANALAADVNAKQATATAKAASAEASAASAAEQVPLATAQANKAANSATSAAEQVPLATAQANNAANSAAAADASRIAASKLNLGSKSTPPTVDNQGAALFAGATYYDTALDRWRVWSGTAWTDGISSVSGVSSIDGKTGAVPLKTINGAPLTAAGNLNLALTSDVSIGIKRAPPAGGTLPSPNGYYAFMTAASYTLPDFTGFDTFGLASLSNSAAVPATFQTSDGWTLSPGLEASAFKAVAPTSSATPHGTWAGILQTPPILGTAATGATLTVIGSVQLSSSLVVILSQGSGNTKHVMAFNPLTGTFGTVVQLSSSGSSGGEGHIYADSATSFVVGYNNGVSTVRAGSVSDLEITLGAAVASSSTQAYERLLQLASGLYVHTSIISTTAGAEAYSVSGTVVTKGANVLAGITAFGTIQRIDATRFLFVGVKSSSPSPLYAMVGTVAGNTITFGTAVTAGASILSSFISTPRFLQAMASGGPFIACMQNASPTTTGAYYGITVSGTTPTVGAVLTLASTLPPARYFPRTYIYPPATDSTQTLLNYSSSQLLATAAVGAFTLSIAGTTLTSGTVFATSSLARLMRDALTGANCYVVADTTVDKITVSGTTISSVYQLAAAPTILSSDTLNDKSVNYGGTWYAWTLPTMACAITADKWLTTSGSNLNFYGPIS